LGELFLQSAKLRDAVKWWKRSAENGDSDAMMRLSQVFREGAIGVPQELGKMWVNFG
jgi:TPR repeat protein